MTHRQTATDPEIVIEELSAGGFFGEKALRGYDDNIISNSH